jgi:N-acetylglutamate synthase-like GNAT family acetyltransferase
MNIVLTRAFGPHYEDTVRLRQRILRDPLGLVLDTSGDDARTFFVAIEDGTVIGTVALEGNRLRAMAVETQKRGVGRALVARLEEEARSRGIARIELHARRTAQGFYEKLGYVAHGEEFIEVTIPHIAMWRWTMATRGGSST